MNDLEVGQVLSLKIRFNNQGTTASVAHPYLIVEINEELGIVEIAQIDSLAGKEWKAFFRSNKVIPCSNPAEVVIDKDSFVQLDNTLRLEKCVELVRFRRQRDKLSEVKLRMVLEAYRLYHVENEIDENKNVYIDKTELLQLN